MGTVTSTATAWVLGSGGLLGSALVRRAKHHNIDVFTGDQIPWSKPHERARIFDKSSRDLAQACARTGTPMVVLWAAGVAGVSSDHSTAMAETEILNELLAALRPHWPSTAATFFLASSAGAVYAASSQAPFTSSSPTVANSPYGNAKLEQEKLLATTLPPGVRGVIGRLGNIYGPPTHGRHGLVSRLTIAALTRSALNLFVPTETLRDYCWSDDAADLIWRDVLNEDLDSCTRIIGSGQAVTISQVIATVQAVTHRKVPLALGTDPESARQPIDLRLKPDWLASPSEIQPLDLASGIKRLVSDLATAPR